ncbi:hypothetical protein THRCLA_09312 [Thraustotheca clavata]|uniref:DDE Tnp4 domain-containing protein n=1 Tax=Thraustotheca clavata TaxID=74557 RepID=A0A1V9YXP0_9STRA|nr:hypothetical protein THRCLA_09312 [Thraustotheca clavata]
MYGTEGQNHALTGVDEKTFRKWCWKWIHTLANLDIIKWENRFKNASEEANIHKFKGPGLRYEVGLCIRTVWCQGGVPAAYVYAVEPGEVTLADKGYRDKNYFVFPSDERHDARRQKEIMARHETCNRRLKQFKILSSTFRHDLHLHPICFHAVANCTQLMIELGHELFSIKMM